MKKTILLLLVILTSGILNAQKLVTTYYDWNKVHPNEQYYVNSAGQKSGSYKQYDQSGVVLKEYNYLNGVENGLCVDYAIGPDNKRMVQAKSNFVNGQPEGYFVEYCSYSGYANKIQEGQNKNGKKTGLWKVWWCDDDTRGVLKEVGSYKNDNQTGQWKKYYRNGYLKEVTNYSDDNLKNGYYACYSSKDSSKPVSKGRYLNNIQVGEWQVLINDDSKVVDNIDEATGYRVITFDSAGNRKPGKVTDYSLTGVKFHECFYDEANHLTGTETSYYEDVHTIFTVKNHETHEFKSFYGNGYPKTQGFITADSKQNGEWKFYSQSDSGKIVNSGKFSSGQCVGSWRIYFDKDSKASYTPEGARYYRDIIFNEYGKPTEDIVHDYTIDGTKIWEGSMVGKESYKFTH